MPITNTVKMAEYKPGYDWTPGRFGPPPGILEKRKIEFDNMSDKEYLYAFSKLSQEEKESLMCSEKERLRTFSAHWPIETIVKARDCAEQGFYYTGVADRVQCAFCGGIVRNWERGDVPKIQHRDLFGYCKIPQNILCTNIPLPSQPIPDTFTSITTDGTISQLNIINTTPKHKQYSIVSKRLETYKKAQSLPVSKTLLCQAGFMYQGPGDKVICFWCDGALEKFSKRDDPFVEHAKWYPGCTFVRMTKGEEYIIQQRSQMSADNIARSDTLIYNKGDLSFLQNAPKIKPPISDLDGYKFCVALGYDVADIKKAYVKNNDEEFIDARELVGIVQALEEGDTTVLDSFTWPYKPEGTSKPNTPPPQQCNEIIQSNTQDSAQHLVTALTCTKCKTQILGAVLLPCGHFSICKDCSYKNLPKYCNVCNMQVRGACRVYLS